jgi:tetratricopeptide (TPR) repeat protein
MGTGVFGFHLTNLLIHLGNVYLVYRLAQELICQQWHQQNLKYVPIFSALLFAVHPINTEAVSYISGRSAALMTLFYLAGLLAYINGRLQQNKLLLHVVTPLSFLLALSVKETAVTFPLALLVWEYFCGGKWRGQFQATWSSWILLLIAMLIFLFSDNYLAQMQRSADFNTFSGNVATQLFAFVYLLRQWALPLWLNIDPDLPVLHGIDNAFWPLLLILMMFAVMLASRIRRPWITFAIAWATIQLLPLYLFLPRIDIANERQMYLAGVPFMMVFCVELSILLDESKMRRVAVIVLISLATLTVLRNQVYSNEIALWEDTAQKSPDKARVHNNLGYAYMLNKQEDQARIEFTVALRLDPHLVKARYNLDRLKQESTQQ